MSSAWHSTFLTLGHRIDGIGDVQLSPVDRESHVYIAGATRTGKTKLIEHLIRQDIGRWPQHRCGMLLIDPHGELYREVMRAVAANPLKDVPIVPIDLTNPDYIVSYNPLRKQEADESAIVTAFVRAMSYVWGVEGTDGTPRFERWVIPLLHTLYQLNYTLLEAPQLLSPHDPTFREYVAPRVNAETRELWDWAASMRRSEFDEKVESTLNRIERFRKNPKLRLMLGSGGESFDFTKAIEEGWIVLVNLSTEGAWGDEEEADTLATLMLTDLWTCAKARGKGKDKRPFRVVIDEFQNFLTPTIAKNLAQAAGFGLHLTLATQFPTQLLSNGSIGQDIYRNVMGNARSKVVFSLEESESLKELAEWLFRGSIDPDQIKHEIYATRAIGQEKITLSSSSSTETESYSEGETENYYEGELQSGSSSREQSSSSTSTSFSEQEAFATIYGKELASRAYRPIDEQLFMATQKIVGQDQRYAYVKTMSMKTPVAMKVPEVQPGLARDPFVIEQTTKRLEKLPFVKRTEDARAQLEARMSVLPTQARANLVDEPATSGRLIRKK